jgi:hypothetical protein
MRHNRRLYIPTLVFAVLILAESVLAHHSFSAEFDINQPFTLTGVLTKVNWENPHVHLLLAVKDNAGKSVSWDIETWPTGLLHRSGLTRQSFAEGQTVTMLLYHAKDGSKTLAYLGKITFSDGHAVELIGPGNRAQDHE